jgi:hypothetical protein
MLTTSTPQMTVKQLDDACRKMQFVALLNIIPEG